ncbi:MAG: CAP domain-containing protein [Verrucomicrobiaceae bacterium]
MTPEIHSSDSGNPQERALIGLIRAHPKQKRAELIYDVRLAAAARDKAQDMAVQGYFAHEDLDGTGPNFRVLATGYRLPTVFRAFKKSNQIESIVAGNGGAVETMKQLMKSGAHKSHVLATGPFYRDQVYYGTGYFHYPNSKYRHYWVVLTAPPEIE